jgi:drug/metabolite transporter (DMT)-like permease
MKKGYLYILLATLFFSSMEVALKLIATQFNPIQLTFIRFLIGSVVLLPPAIHRMNTHHITLGADDLRFFALSGLICVVVSMSLYQLAILNAQASIVAVLFSCNPIFVIPLAHFLLREEIHKFTLISMILSVIGMLWIMNPMHLTSSYAGIIYILLAAVTFALYTVIGKGRSSRYGVVVLNCFSFLMGSLEMLVLILASRLQPIAEALLRVGMGTFARIPLAQGITWQNVPGLLYIGVGVTGLGFLFYFLAMQETSASTGALVFYIKPALAPIFALVLLHESIRWNVWVGIAFILFGSAVTFMMNTGQTRHIRLPELVSIPISTSRRR